MLSASAATLNFSSSTDTLELELRNGGRGELELLELIASESWLQLTPLNTADSGLGLYEVEVARSGLETGVYSAEISARSSVNTITIRVIMYVGDSAAADVGVIYVLLYKQGEDDPVAQVSATAQGGRYSYAFSNVTPGLYEVYAGTDADNDLLICDAGEACGSWLTVDQPIVIDLASNRDDINFPVDYLVAIPTIETVADSSQRRQSRVEARQRRASSR